MLRARLVLIPHFAVVQLVGNCDVGMAAQLAEELFIMLVVQLDVPQHITRRENATKQQFMKLAVQLAAQLATQHNLWYNTTGLAAIAKNRTEI